MSIIIPLYNVANYVVKCISSLEDQDIPTEQYEIICVNDGSPDNCREIVIELQQIYSNIILIEQMNQGVSIARNIGLNQATGKYILFIDPDDHVEPNTFASILEKVDGSLAQVSFLGFTFLDENGQVRTQVLNEDLKSRIFSGPDAYRLARGDGRTDPDRIWAVLFSREFIEKNNLRFLPNVPFLEDGELIARTLCLADRCIFDGRSFYLRTTRRGSATNSKLFFSERATEGFLLASGNLKKFCMESPLDESQRIFLNQPITKFVMLALNSTLTRGSRGRLNKTIKVLKEMSLDRLIIKGCSKEYCLYALVYNLSPYLAVFALIVYPRFRRLYDLIFKAG